MFVFQTSLFYFSGHLLNLKFFLFFRFFSIIPPVNGQLMGNNFNTATLDEATIALIKRKTKMKSSEITNWHNELKVIIKKNIISISIKIIRKDLQKTFLFFLLPQQGKFPISFLINFRINATGWIDSVENNKIIVPFSIEKLSHSFLTS